MKDYPLTTLKSYKQSYITIKKLVNIYQVHSLGIIKKHITNGLMSSSVAGSHVSPAQRDNGLLVEPVFNQNKLLEGSFLT